jgi:hypothetical protein
MVRGACKVANVEENGHSSGLSEEQADTDRLLRDLLGTAIADRYRDFCRLASGALPLTVSRPLAGHALRELDSLIRHVLATPMEARAIDDEEQVRCRRKARRLLKKMGFDDGAVQRAGDALKPKFSHKVQIEKIVTRLGLAPDSDVAKLWVELNETYGRVHERSFHERLEVDEAFRAKYAHRFDTVVRVLAIQLQSRYAALMRRAKEIAAMPPADGIALFLSEIPGAVQLQGYFYDTLPSEGWLSFLVEAGLLREPLPDAQGGTRLRLWTWPIGRYLVRLASSADAGTREGVAQAIRGLASSTHPDVQHFGLDVVAALPPDEAAKLTDVIAGWLTPKSSLFQAAPHTIIATIAQAGYVEAALRATEAVFQVFQREGELAAFFEPVMYEHYLAGAVNVLAKAGPLEALPRFGDLLLRASHLDRGLGAVKEEDYSYYTVGSLESHQMDGGDILATLIRAIVKLAKAAVEANASNVSLVLEVLAKYKPKIFRRIELHLLALAPGQTPERAEAYLTDTALLQADWCRQEYGELATAWFPNLRADRKKLVFDFVDSLPNVLFDGWRSWFEENHKREPSQDEGREFRECIIRDVVWAWRDALPPERRAALDKTVADFGDPDAWRGRYLGRGQSSLSRASMQAQSINDAVAYLDAWRPDPDLRLETAGALANELREAAAAKPELFSASAAKFAGLRPLFIRNLFDGLRQSAANKAKIDWAQAVALMAVTLERSKHAIDASLAAPGDDPNWSWALKSAVEWLASGLWRGAEGIEFSHAEAVQSLVVGLYRRIYELPAAEGNDGPERKHPFFAAQATAHGAAIELCLLLLLWQSKDRASAIGKAPREALRHAQEIRGILEEQLENRSPQGWIPRAILGHYLRWLFYFAETWLGVQLSKLFPSDNKELRDSAWFAYLQSNLAPLGELVGALQAHYVEKIAGLGGLSASAGKEEDADRLAEHLMVLYLWDVLPANLLQLFWASAPATVRRRAMWFIGRHLPPNNDFHARAVAYWDRRLQLAARAADPEPYRQELGTIGQWFSWDNLDPLWLMDQLLLMLNAGFGPNEALGVIDKIAEQLPKKTDQAVEIMKALVREPKVEAWIFASQGGSLRKILSEGKKSPTPMTADSVKEIVSYLAARGNPGFLDLDD